MLIVSNSFSKHELSLIASALKNYKKTGYVFDEKRVGKLIEKVESMKGNEKTNTPRSWSL